jgi:subtilase family serine protease
MFILASGTDIQVQTTLNKLMGEPASVQKYIIGAECMAETIDPQPAKSTQPPSYTPTDVRGINIGTSPLSSGGKGTGLGTCTPELLSSGSTPYLEAWLPCGLQAIYDENPLLQQGVSGSHQTIALVDAFGDPDTTAANSLSYENLACSDLALFDSTFHLPNSGCSVIYPTGVPQLSLNNYADAEGWATETAIDMQYSHTMAPQAHILEVTSSTDWDDLYASIEYVVNHQMANVISLSWGSWEDLFYYPSTAALMLGYDEIFQQAAAQGIGVFVSSGDYAAYDPVFASSNPASPLYPYGEVSASSPATDPWVSGVGGTTLNATFTPFSVYRLEHAWSLGSDYYCLICGTGGGFSMLFKEPVGQQLVHISTQVSSIPEPALGITFYPHSMRGVPDLAADADPTTGILVIQDGAFSPYVWGGTSLAAPLTAGMTATVQSGTRFYTIGDLAPSLYLLYLQMNHGFYVYQNHFSLSELSHGVSGVMFETAYGQNGPFQVTPGVWNPVDGLGQLNVYGLSHVISSVSYGT